MSERLRRADEAEVRRLAATTPFLWIWLILLGIAAFQIYFDPLGFSRLTQRYSQDLVNLTVTGPLYPDTGRDQISVMLTDDASLEALGLTWPISYGDHARALDALLAYQPRAVVIDVLFVDDRNDPSLADLLRVIDRYKRAHVPLYFSAASNLAKPVRNEIRASGVNLVDVKTLVDGGVARQYPARAGCVDLQRAPDCPSMAVRVYDDLYPGETARDAPPDSNIELVWGVDTHPINRKVMKVKDEDGQVQRCPADAGIATRIYRALVDVTRLRTICPHTAVIPAEALVRGDEDPDLPGLIGKRIVFYGASLEGSADKTYSPANGLLAGVFVHAMALDNLITFGGHPKRDAVNIFGVVLHKDEVETITIALVLLVIVAIHLRRIRIIASLPEHHEPPALDRWRSYGLLLGMIVASGVVLYIGYGLSIGNWVELVFMAGLLFEFLLTPFLARQWGRLRYGLGV